MAQTMRLASFGPILVIATLRTLLIMSKHRLNLKIISYSHSPVNELPHSVSQNEVLSSILVQTSQKFQIMSVHTIPIHVVNI